MITTAKEKAEDFSLKIQNKFSDLHDNDDSDK